MAHRTKVLIPASEKLVATCSCGWIGEDRAPATVAKRDADNHELQALRGATPPARTAGGK